MPPLSLPSLTPRSFVYLCLLAQLLPALSFTLTLPDEVDLNEPVAVQWMRDGAQDSESFGIGQQSLRTDEIINITTVQNSAAAMSGTQSVIFTLAGQTLVFVTDELVLGRASGNFTQASASKQIIVGQNFNNPSSPDDPSETTSSTTSITAEPSTSSTSSISSTSSTATSSVPSQSATGDPSSSGSMSAWKRSATIALSVVSFIFVLCVLAYLLYRRQKRAARRRVQRLREWVHGTWVGSDTSSISAMSDPAERYTTDKRDRRARVAQSRFSDSATGGLV